MPQLTLPVSTTKVTALARRMEKLGIRESELAETFTRSGGKGGQNVNKVSTAVRISHAASGIDLKCSIHRTQGMNRYAARILLCEKLEQRERDLRAEENPVHKKKRMAKLNRARKAKRKKAALAKKKVVKENWRDSREW